MSQEPTAEFTFTWQALKLLGKSLYSNPWAAISELVANGFDANASTVYVLLDTSMGKDKAVLEVLDDGLGMDELGIQQYVQVGRNKRLDPETGGVSHPMGRKGIGKLAALYLSDEFYLATRHERGESVWRLAVDENLNDSQKPHLVKGDDTPRLLLEERWGSLPTGTLLSIRDIDLRGSGSAALNALGSKLANQFLLTSMNARQIHLCVRSKAGEELRFLPVEKQVAFNNYMMLYSHFESSADLPKAIGELSENTVLLNVGSSRHSIPVVTGDLKQLAGPTADPGLSGTISLLDRTGQTREVKYCLTGWLAVHATIHAELAQENDPSFVKNKFYNPAQIRLYVRNKLAAENVLQMLGITQAFTNYIEGEVSFDILDEDQLADIATTNRQGFDENDVRVNLLQGILKPLVSSLIRERERTMKALRKDQADKEVAVQTRAKEAFLREVREEFENAAIDPSVSESLMIPIGNKLSGDTVHAKSAHRLFLSHASGDSDLLDVIYYALLEQGALPEEIFYTSKEKSYSVPELYDQLKDMMRDCITDSKTRILYVTSPAFVGSMFCLFEGGAGWATRGMGDFDLLTTRFESAPTFLHNNQPIQNLLDADGKLSLTLNVHVALIEVLNKMIRHLNLGREIEGKGELVRKFNTDVFPPSHERDKPDIEYMNPVIVRLWEHYIRILDEAERYPPK